MSNPKGSKLVGTRKGIIRFGIDAEIDKALSLFCRDDLRLSKVYWPKAFRALVMNILKELLTKPATWSELCTHDTIVNEGQLQTLIDELMLSTSKYIKVKQRHWIVHLLREISLFRRKFGLNVRLPNMYGGCSDWPTDLEDKNDLSTSMTSMSLRDDVNNYIWRVLDEVIPTDRYCNLHYYGATPSHAACPIEIEVTEDFVEIVTDRIKTISEQLMLSNFENLLPSDLIQIKRVPIREPVAAIEEGFFTSGSPWKEGTVGGIVTYGDRFIGITSGHVHCQQNAAFDVICDDVGPELRRVVEPKVDVAFFTFADGEGNQDVRFNLTPLQYIGAMGDVGLQIGEPVYKMGRSTGLTVGRLGAVQATFRTSSGFRYEDHVQVEWNEDGCRFASSMDCGSLYCVKRGPMYVPIGIHRISDINVSYGCSIWKAMEFFPEIPNLLDAPVFVNPPLLIINAEA